jgi:hypothetical protein
VGSFLTTGCEVMRVTKYTRILVGFASLAVLTVPFSPALAGVANPQGGPPDIQRVAFVHYAQGYGPAANPAKPGGPGGGAGGSGNAGPALYKLSGLRWATGNIDCIVSKAGEPGTFAGNDTTFLEAVTTSLSAWDVRSSGFSVSIDRRVSTTLFPGVVDNNNVVGWADLGTGGAIAITYISFNAQTKVVTEIDTALNSNLMFQWWIVSNQAGWSTNAYDVDVQNIMTHEAGHWLVLNDLYSKPTSEQTMYGYSAQNELKKRSLESGDIAGIVAIYGQ